METANNYSVVNSHGLVRIVHSVYLQSVWNGVADFGMGASFSGYKTGVACGVGPLCTLHVAPPTL